MIPLKRKNNSPDSFASQVELADIFKDHSSVFLTQHPAGNDERKVIRDILSCRTPSLGGRIDICETGCGFVRLSFNSCRNRHCPKCQSLNKIKWLNARSLKLLPTKYFHVVITMPHQLNPLTLQNKRLVYSLLFKASAKSLTQLTLTWPRFQAQPGFTAILHTWTQELKFHPHLHIICTAGGLSLDDKKWISSSDKFLVPLKALGKIVRAKFLDELKMAYEQNELRLSGKCKYLQNPAVFYKFARKLRRKKWVLYIKPPFSNPNGIFSYLGHYTHRVAISNQRLLATDPTGVTFRVRNNDCPGTYKQIRLPVMEFIQRFLTHVLPSRFVRIRHYGLLAPKNTNTKLELARSLIPNKNQDVLPDLQKSTETWQQLLKRLTGFDVTICPQCGGNIKSVDLETLSYPVGKPQSVIPAWDTS